MMTAGEAAQLVESYHFADENGKPISFTAAPFYLGSAVKSGATKARVILHGAMDGDEDVDAQVSYWKLRLRKAQPELFVLVSGGDWLKLGEPEEGYRDRFRSIMITIEWLHYVRRWPEVSENELWGHLCNIFSSLKVRPSENDLVNHVSLIKTIAERDKTLAQAKPLMILLEQHLERRSCFGVVAESNSVTEKPSCANDNMVNAGINEADDDESVEEPGLFDSVCPICDDGGDLLYCKGRCLRGFHPSKDAGADSGCESLGYTAAQVEGIPNFFCDNCRYKQHQCFACGDLGSSDKATGAEVFRCATCGYFYHPKCVAQLLHQRSEIEPKKFQEKVAAGESFICPMHKCATCNEREDTTDYEMQFAVCRRCPTSYHRKCLPREIKFFRDFGRGVSQRAWNGVIPNRILIYCLKHKIDETLQTPSRNHITFPKNLREPNKIRIPLKRKVSDNSLLEQPRAKSCKSAERDFMPKESCSFAKGKFSFASGRKPKECTGSDRFKVSLKDKAKISARTVSQDRDAKIICSTFPVADDETIRRLQSLMNDVSSSLTHEDVSKRLHPSTHAYSTKQIANSPALRVVEASVESIKMALQKLEDGTINIDEAKEICDPRLLSQMDRWRKHLKVYLAPVLHGKRYTSYGRHFTKVDKLKQIVDKLHWYVQDGDMIVDFSCGANDFSTLIKSRLDAAAKRCYFTNYDIIQPKIDFNFERRDWMTVRPEELPDGSQLIIGLNPPFGVRAARANEFIEKALSFRPKLLILIVPEETKRLDHKQPPYDLIWEDREMLSGKSFYLPGSIDVDAKQMEQWNCKAPVLYLWSRADWTTKHRDIALQQGHIWGTPTLAWDIEHPQVGPSSHDGVEEAVTPPRAEEPSGGARQRQPEAAESIQRTPTLSWDNEHPQVGPSSHDGVEAATPPRSEEPSGGASQTEANTEALGDGEIDDLSDMDISPVHNALETERNPPPVDLKNADGDMGCNRNTHEMSDGFACPVGFAAGPLPGFMHPSSSGGWIDD